MCNAWNHPLSCTCGWGGEGSRGGGGSHGAYIGIGLAKFSDLIRNRYRQEAAAYVNPNAKCPVCGDPVYYYQSPEGGRVFFDHLGKPWPKHPCTDSITDRFENVDLLADRSTGLKPSDWLPFICNSIHPAPLLGEGVYVLEGLYDYSELKLFCKVSGLNIRSPYLLKKTDDSGSNFSVTSVMFKGREAVPIEFQATRSAINLIPEHLRSPPLPIPTKKTSKKIKGNNFVLDAKRAALAQRKNIENKPEKQPQPRKNILIGPTAMELAFGRANLKIDKK